MIEPTRCECERRSRSSAPPCSACSKTPWRASSDDTTGQEQRSRHFTPPPSRPRSPRRRRDASSSASSHTSAAGLALSHALASEERVSNIFPHTLYREPSPSLSRRSLDSRRSSEASRAGNAQVHASRTQSRPATPDGLKIFEGGYAPMAAGFARLSIKSGNSVSSDQHKAQTTTERRRMIGLDARLFDGPA